MPVYHNLYVQKRGKLGIFVLTAIEMMVYRRVCTCCVPAAN